MLKKKTIFSIAIVLLLVVTGTTTAIIDLTGTQSGTGGVGVEVDPVFGASPAAGIVSGDITNWNEAYSWGNHSLFGYLTSESDPVFSASPASGISSSNITNWNEAYSWGGCKIIEEPDGTLTLAINDTLNITYNGETEFQFMDAVVDFAELAFGMPPSDPMTLPTEIKSFSIPDFFGGEGLVFQSIGIIPLTNVGFPFNFAGMNQFSIYEPDNDLLTDGNSLGARFSAYEKDSGATAIGFILNTDFGGHRLTMGTVDDNVNLLPTFEFAATGGYSEPEEADPIENPRFVLQAQDAGSDEWWLRFYPKPVDSGLEEAFDPFGVMFGDGTSNHSLHSGDVVITKTFYEDDEGGGDYIGGNFEVQGTSYLETVHVNDALHLTPLGTAPSNPTAGTMYFCSNDNVLKVYDGATWQNCW